MGRPQALDLPGLTTLLAGEGFIAAEEEAAELLVSAAGDGGRLQQLVRRRLTGEPLAWVTGTVSFCGLAVHVHPGVYVPRAHSELLARRAVVRLPVSGSAIDVCTGSGAIAVAVQAERPLARVIACDIDPRAVDCARANGVNAFRGDLFAPVPSKFKGQVDVIVAVAPYVPRNELSLLQRDTFTFESTMPYDGGPDGTTILRRVLSEGRDFLRARGTLLLELGGDQAALLHGELVRLGYRQADVLRDNDGSARGIECTRESG